MKNKLMFGVLVKNHDEVIDFYKKLGFDVVEDNPMGDERWITITLPGNDGCSPALHLAANQGGPGVTGRTGLAAGKRRP